MRPFYMKALLALIAISWIAGHSEIAKGAPEPLGHGELDVLKAYRAADVILRTSKEYGRPDAELRPGSGPDREVLSGLNDVVWQRVEFPEEPVTILFGKPAEDLEEASFLYLKKIDGKNYQVLRMAEFNRDAPRLVDDLVTRASGSLSFDALMKESKKALELLKACENFYMLSGSYESLYKVYSLALLSKNHDIQPGDLAGWDADEGFDGWGWTYNGGKIEMTKDKDSWIWSRFRAERSNEPFSGGIIAGYTLVETQKFKRPPPPPPDGLEDTVIYYWSSIGGGSEGEHLTGLYTRHPDGTRGEQKLEMEPEDWTFSPDAKRIAYEDGGDISVVESNGKNPRDLTKGRKAGREPIWSPDGRTITYISLSAWPGGEWQTHFIDPEGKEDVVPPALDKMAFLNWSPDMTRCLLDKQGDVFLSDLSFKDVRPFLVTHDVGAACWSPNGQMIALERYRDRGKESALYTLRADGTGMTWVAGGEERVSSFCWSPDSKKLAFITAEEDSRPGTLFTVNADGTGLRQLTVDGTIKRLCYYSWR